MYVRGREGVWGGGGGERDDQIERLFETDGAGVAGRTMELVRAAGKPYE